MRRSEIPFNIKLLELTPAKMQAMRPTTSLDSFLGATRNFHDDGLFSVLTFGKVGTDERNTRFSFIDVKVQIFHPIIYRTLVSLKRLYAGILAGAEYAVWNEDLKDFEKADAMTGKTGFAFFVKYWKDIAFTESKSTLRQISIKLIEMARGTGAMTNQILVLPAGLRDLEFTDDGRIQEDDVNGLYRRVLNISNTISESAVKGNPEIIDTARFSLQIAFNEIFENFESMLEGKKKLVMGRWASRRPMNGTRNVITAMNTSVPYLNAPGALGFNHTAIGLYQAMKAALPISIYRIRNGFLSKVFRGPGVPARLVDKKTMHAKDVDLPSKYFDRFATNEGIEKVITSFSEASIRMLPLEIEGHYVGLIYRGPDMTFRFMQDIDELPSTRNKEDVHPVTFVELLYLSLYAELNKYPIFVTRYPVTGVGSIYPSKVFLKTTVDVQTRRELGDDWSPLDDNHVAYQYPTNSAFIDSLIPHSSKLVRLGADFDGDTASGNITVSNESMAEVDKFLSLRRAYVGTDGRPTSSIDVSTVQLVFHNLTGD